MLQKKIQLLFAPRLQLLRTDKFPILKGYIDLIVREILLCVPASLRSRP
jgi:hypothetical protein